METDNSATIAVAPEEWDAPGEVEVSPAADCAPAVGAEVVCSGEGSQSGARKRGKRRPNFKQTSSRPEDERCSGCRVKFERHGRSFNRRALCTFTNLETARWTFPQAAEQLQESSFLCETCAQLIRSKYRKRQCGKRTLWIRPINTAQMEPQSRPKEKRSGKKSRAALLVSQSRYKSAFRVLWSARGARKPMMDFISKQLKLEMKELSRQHGSPFHQKVASSKPMSMFPWRRCLNWAQEKAPLVTHCIRAMFPDAAAIAKSSHVLTEEQAGALLDRRIVTALSIPLFTRNVYKNNFVQASLGAELRLQGVSGSGLDSLNALGLCQNKDTVRLLLLRLLQGRRGRLLSNGRFGQRLKQEQLKAHQSPDVEQQEGSEEVEAESDTERAETELTADEVEDEVEEDLEENDEEESKERTRKKRKHRKEEEETDESKKGRVVVVRLGLLHEHADP
ncbi:hypothetical protein NL108_006500 [Boleophthalmus pectinirostris]|uniref:uncharacterized protein LOC110166426 n=1 Tax=Boleophthalmus pectinirostris TaxID=150288 RepID=UPI000A1C49B3|nr:uncharacterized protein LOC110166426 [Boleophthalmus pectinirostris]KAJ0049957.1 hypothetical protein NL108_006500 [Boleophthalmus pectinirostris]